jgi:hypothetical protein
VSEDPTSIYGPNTAQVTALLERIAQMTTQEIQDTGVAWSANRAAAFSAYYRTADDSAYHMAYTAAITIAAGALGSAAPVAIGAAEYAVGSVLGDLGTAEYPVYDAVLAVATNGLITTDQYQLLIGPLSSVIGPTFF